MERGSSVDVGGGVELHDIGRGLLEEHAAVQVEVSNLFQERSAIVAADDEQAEGKVLKRGDRTQERREALFFPIVADKKQDEFGFWYLQNFAGVFAPAKALGQVKTRQINGIGNHRDILPGKMPGELSGRQLRNGCQTDPRIAIDTVFQSYDQAVVQNAVEEYRPTRQRSITQTQILMYKPEELVKDDMNYNRVGIRTVDPRGENDVEAK